MKARKEWQRARRPEEKEERREAILAAANVLLDSAGLDETGLNAIAREAGISKANIYRYFESREAILLELLLDEVSAWSQAFAKRLAKLADSHDFDAVAKAFADLVAKRERFCVLVSSLATVLEHNVSCETVIAFKRSFLGAVEPAVSAVAVALPAFSEELAFSALAMLVMAASGAWPHCHPSPIVAEVLELPEFEPMRLDFKRTMQTHASALLRGLADG